MDELIALDPKDFDNPTLVPLAVKTIRPVVAALNILSPTETAKILRGIADMLDQQAARNERGRNN